ncbi:MAG TPA: DUF1616 domain-containing protein [Candidatus Bathyarchaeia archaeon]|nr:DUF1616 domain-containing protein [Candidatus Bathyarchaeia archaeon]
MDTVVLSIFRSFFAIALLFFVPGFCLTVLLFPRKQALRSLERSLAAVITSVLVSIADSAFLLITVGLNFATLTLSLSALGALFAAFAFARWRRLPRSDRYAVFGGNSNFALAALGAAMCLCLAVVGTTILLSPHASETSYSDFYVLDNNGQTVAYPTNVTLGSSTSLILGITNHENATDSYAGTVSLGNSTIYRFGNLTLAQGQNIERTIPISFTSLGDKQKLKFTLADSFNKTYELHLWVNVRAPT